MPTYPSTIRECVGTWLPITLQGSFDSAAAAGDLWTRDVDATVAVRTFEAPFDGYVSWMAVDTVGGSLSVAVFTIQIEGVEDTDAQFNPGEVAANAKVYKPSQVQFSAGNSIAVEIDSYTTFRDCCVTLGLVCNVAAY